MSSTRSEPRGLGGGILAVVVLVSALFAQPLLGSGEEQAGTSGHVGPRVAPGDSGPARYVGALYDKFDDEAALKLIEFADGFYRAPGNPGYDATLDRVRARLQEFGFGKRAGYELEELETPLRTPAWTPESASLDVLLPDGETLRLHGFDKPGDPDRVMLPINAPSADVEGVVVFAEEDVEQGTILVSAGSVGDRRIAQLVKKGAVAVISSRIAGFTRDPSGGDGHLDAIQFRSVSPNVRLPVAQISPRSQTRLEALAKEHGDLRLRLRAKVSFKEGQLRTLVARIIGSELPDEVVAIASHVQEPGAGDNASGVSGLCEGVVSLVEGIADGSLSQPMRSLAFIWGDEMRQSSIWLEHTERRVIAGISADMLGQSQERTGAICLLEREPDPGALDTLPPDKHTPWGAGAVKESDLLPSGLSLIARSALHDVGLHVGGWTTSENPWEGGSDHDVFLKRKIPALLIWHFTDYTYHTSLDRVDRLDPEELRRSATAILGTALAVANLRQADRARLAASNALELELRVESALAAERPDVAKRWREWCHGVDQWIAARCVDPEEKE